MKTIAFNSFLLLSLFFSQTSFGQSYYIKKAIRDKQYKEHGKDGEDKLNKWLGDVSDVKVAKDYSFPMYIQMHNITYKNGKVKDESDIDMYLNAAKSQAGIMISEEKKKKKQETMFTVYDYVNNNSVIFNLEEKTYMAINMNAFMSKENQEKRSTGNAKVNDNIDCKKTGKTKTIQGYKCSEYVCTYKNSDEKHEMWVSTQLPVTMSKAMAMNMKRRAQGDTEGMNGAVLEEYDYKNDELIREMKVTVIDPKRNYSIATSSYKNNSIGNVSFED